jgi:DNA-binding NarL/FixJ family response regulator
MKESNIIHIALLDDHKMFLDGMNSMLQSIENFKIVFVENTAKKALLQLKEFTPDIIITDISMPEMNGIEFIKEVKKYYPGIKILVLSMFHYLQSMDGIDGFFLKETDSKELIKAIYGIVLEGKKYYLDTQKASDTLQFKKTILTTREKEIVLLIAEEKTTDEIASKLNVSKTTIESHRKNIFFKLKVNNVAGLIKKAIILGFINE